MRILIVSRYKDNFLNNVAPFVTEQGAALTALNKLWNERVSELGKIEVDYFLVKGNYLKAVNPLKEKIRKWKPDVIHAHYGITAIVAELQNMVPVVTTFHDGETHNWYVNLLSSLFSLRAKHVIYVAQHIHELAIFKAKNYTILPCGIPMEKMVVTPYKEARKKLGWSKDKKYILFGGAFDNERKNYKLLRDAVQRLNDEMSRDKSLSEPLTLNDGSEQFGNIVCAGMYKLTREECVLRMCGADLFVLPSRREGSPQVVKEAMAVNCPCLVTDVADVRVLFGDEPGHFILRNPLGMPEHWEADERSLDEMVELLKEGLAFQGRTNGRERILKLGLTNEQVAKHLIKIYETVLEKKTKINTATLP